MTDMPDRMRTFQFGLRNMFAITAIIAVILFAFRQGSPASFLLLFVTTIITICIATLRAFYLRKSVRVFCICYAAACTIGLILTCNTSHPMIDVNILRSMYWGLSGARSYDDFWFAFYGSSHLGNIYLIATITWSVVLGGAMAACHLLWQRIRNRTSA